MSKLSIKLRAWFNGTTHQYYSKKRGNMQSSLRYAKLSFCFDAN